MNAVATLQQENHALKTTLFSKDQRIAQLEELLRSFNRRQYGASSEQSPDQGHLFDEAEQTFDDDALIADNTTTVPAHTRKKRRRVSIPADIPRQDIIHDLPDDQKFCPHDGTALQCIDKETHEQLDIAYRM